MKLRNKKTGKIVDVESLVANTDGSIQMTYIDEDYNRQLYITGYLKVFVEEWEDYEEPKEYFYIYANQVLKGECDGIIEKKFKEIGNYFETKEEAEKAVEKLKAWKRLKDKGFRFNGITPMEYFIRFTYDKPRQILDNQQHPEVAQQFNKDLDLLFGGEE